MTPLATVAAFPATLGSREKLITYLVGYGVGIGIPMTLGITFATAFDQLVALLLPLPFALIFGGCYFLRPRCFLVTPREITIARPLRPKSIPLDRLKAIACPASHPPGFTIGLFRVAGVHGTFGTFWNRTWGRFHMFVTDHEKQVELLLADGSRIIVSPDDPVGFVGAVKAAAVQTGVPPPVNGRGHE